MTTPEWPAPLGAAAYHGVVGDFVRTVEPHSEADPAAVLVQTLVCLGNAFGRSPHFMVEDTRHGTNLFAAVVGDTATARKGTSLDRAMRFAKAADPAWAAANEGDGGLSSAEGLIHAVRDPNTGGDRPDAGVQDKRLLAAMGEFAETLSRMKRDGNPLSATLRNAWDGKTLRLRTRKVAIEASGAHVSVIGHITVADLGQLLERAEIFNGFGNRFLWVAAKRSKHLPFGGDLDADALSKSARRAADAVFWAEERPRRIDLDTRAQREWPKLYEELGHGREGRFGAITDRAEPQVRRLALVYAVLDKSPRVKIAHLNAALEVWRYCEDSAAYLFADAVEPRGQLATRVTRALQRSGDWTPLSQLSQKTLKGEVKSYKLKAVLDELVGDGVIEHQKVRTRGRPREEYRMVAG